MKLKQNAPLARYTTFNVGGIARYLSIVKSVEEVKEVFSFISENHLPHIILGRGSNSLIKEKEFAGVVIINKIDDFKIEGDVAFVGSGFSFPLLATRLASLNLSGLEFASGVPGSVGGAIYMNAGAIGQSTSDCLETVEFVDVNGEVFHFAKEDMTFDYRYSPFQEMNGMITSATFQLKEGIDSKENIRQMLEYRFQTQPYKAKTAGCFFRNPKEGSAGAIIDSLGLKGLCVGGARVSTIHANFIENFENATAEDILELVALIQTIVYEKKGIHLEIEVKLLGT